MGLDLSNFGRDPAHGLDRRASARRTAAGMCLEVLERKLSVAATGAEPELSTQRRSASGRSDPRSGRGGLGDKLNRSVADSGGVGAGDDVPGENVVMTQHDRSPPSATRTLPPESSTGKSAWIDCRGQLLVLLPRAAAGARLWPSRRRA